MKELPWFAFYAKDWLNEPTLRICTHAAKGVYIDILCLMHISDERGVLITSGRPWTEQEVVWAIGGSQEVTLSGIQELLAKGVISRDGRGAYFSRRMVRDEQARRKAVADGRRGGNPQFKGGVNPTLNPPVNQLVNGPSVLSISDSSSVFREGGCKGEGSDGAAGTGMEATKRIYAAFPRQAKREAAFREIANAVIRIRDRGQIDPHGWLLDRVRKFAQSSIGKAGNKFCPHCDKWMEDGRYDDDEREWNPTDKSAATENLGRVAAPAGKYDRITEKARQQSREAQGSGRVKSPDQPENLPPF